MWCCLRAFGQIELVTALALTPVVMLHNLLPATPGGFGVREGFAVIVFGAFGFAAGFAGVLLLVVIGGAVLLLSIPAYPDVGAERAAVFALTLAHVPLMFIEGFLTAVVVTFLQRVKPDVLEEEVRPADPPERSVAAAVEG